MTGPYALACWTVFLVSKQRGLLMSQLQVLKGQITQVGSSAKTTASSLAGFKSKFSQAVSQVQATVGGSATNVDRDMIATLQAAEKQVDAAIAALESAAQSASKYAASI